MLMLTLSLGVWQMQRLAWKRDLLVQIDRGEAAPPVPLAGQPPPFTRVVTEGIYMAAAARYGAEVRAASNGPVMGAQVIGILERAGADTLVVDRGWAPLDADPPIPTGSVRVVGYVRPPEYPVRFGAKDDPATRHFYALDPAAIGAALGVTRVAPLTLVELGPIGSIPVPAQSLPRPPNDHLSYAITWFALSAALVMVFVVYLRQQVWRGGSP